MLWNRKHQVDVIKISLEERPWALYVHHGYVQYCLIHVIYLLIEL